METPARQAAEKMDGIYRRQRFIYDATRRYYLLGRNRMLANLQVPQGGSVLEIGCGTARNLIRTARLYPSAKLYGLDISEEMLRTARSGVARAGFDNRIRLAAGDATAFSAEALFGVGAFDRVFISYALSMIPPWGDVVQRAAECVGTQGRLHIVDFGDFSGLPAWLRRAQLAWLQRFSVTPIPDLEGKLETIAEQLGFSAATTRLYGGYAVETCLKRR